MNWNSIERKGFHGAQTRLSIFMGTKRRRLRMVNNKTHSHANEVWLSLGNSMWPDQHERPEIPSEKNLEQVPKGVKLQTNLHTILSIYALPVKDVQHVPDRLILQIPSES